jgi:5'-methylthioadenosine phosphorylase
VRDCHLCLHRGSAIRHLGRKPYLQNLGYSVIGMPNMPEAKLAREAEICCATVAMVTDFDCWYPDHDAVTCRTFSKCLRNAEKDKGLVARLASDFPREHKPRPIGSNRGARSATALVSGATLLHALRE